jgi:hypothetical protein
MGNAVYSPPEVRDYGSLVALTADFDATFLGSVAKVVTMAAVSPVVGGGGGGGGGGNTVLPDSTGPQAQGPSGGGGTGGEVLSGDPVGTGGGGGGSPSGGTAAGGGGGTVSTAGAGDDPGGKLPFTGLALAVMAWAGAVMTGAGIAVKAKLRRRA